MRPYDLVLQSFFFFFKKWAIPGLFFIYFRLFNTVDNKQMLNKICRWLESNRGPLVSKASALPTEPQPLPKVLQSLPNHFRLFSIFTNQWQIIVSNKSWKKHRCCARDLNPGPQEAKDGSIHCAMAASTPCNTINLEQCSKSKHRHALNMDTVSSWLNQWTSS